MNPNGAIAAKPAPRMINDVTPPYADALPAFAKAPAQPQPQAEVSAQPQPVIQAQPIPAPAAVAPVVVEQAAPEQAAPAVSIPVAQAPAPVSPVAPMFPEASASSVMPSVPSTVSAPAAPNVSPMFESRPQAVPVMPAEAPVPMADANLTQPIIAQPILPGVSAQPAKKAGPHWMAVAIAVLVAAGLGVAAYLAFKQAG